MAKQVNIYVCGPTVYSDPHIGNMRPILTFDIVIRALRFLGNEVNFIHNITDIDDKIIAKAQAEKTTETSVAEKYTQEYLELLEKLNIQTPSHVPKVLDNMELIIDFVQELVDNKKAYVVDGTVYFDVNSITNYGALANRKLDESQYELGQNKRHPADFALWKKTDVGMKFTSPWSEGRPGWHTECAAFIYKHLKGKPLDIHGGGIDLLFPHHENENAQYEAICGSPITQVWKHVGHLSFEGDKMSKSLGNVLPAKYFIQTYGEDTLRYIFLTSSFTSPIDFNDETVKFAQEQITKLKKAFAKSKLLLFDQETKLQASGQKVATAIADWNFSEAMKLLNENIKNFNKMQSSESAWEALTSISLLGFAFVNKIVITKEMVEMYNLWERLIKEKKFTDADALREKLRAFWLV